MKKSHSSINLYEGTVSEQSFCVRSRNSLSPSHRLQFGSDVQRRNSLGSRQSKTGHGITSNPRHQMFKQSPERKISRFLESRCSEQVFQSTNTRKILAVLRTKIAELGKEINRLHQSYNSMLQDENSVAFFNKSAKQSAIECTELRNRLAELNIACEMNSFQNGEQLISELKNLEEYNGKLARRVEKIYMEKVKLKEHLNDVEKQINENDDHTYLFCLAAESQEQVRQLKNKKKKIRKMEEQIKELDRLKVNNQKRLNSFPKVILDFLSIQINIERIKNGLNNNDTERETISNGCVRLYEIDNQVQLKCIKDDLCTLESEIINQLTTIATILYVPTQIDFNNLQFDQSLDAYSSEKTKCAQLEKQMKKIETMQTCLNKKHHSICTKISNIPNIIDEFEHFTRINPATTTKTNQLNEKKLKLEEVLTKNKRSLAKINHTLKDVYSRLCSNKNHFEIISLEERLSKLVSQNHEMREKLKEMEAEANLSKFRKTSLDLLELTNSMLKEICCT